MDSEAETQEGDKGSGNSSGTQKEHIMLDVTEEAKPNVTQMRWRLTK